MKISVLINTHNRAAALRRCLDSVMGQDYPKNLVEVLVLDDAGADETPALLAEKAAEFRPAGFRDFKSFRNDTCRNIVYGRYFLQEASDCESELLVYMDDDGMMERGVLSGLAAFFKSAPAAGIAAPAVYYLSEPARRAHGAFFMHSWTGRYTETLPDTATECDWVNATCLAARREAVEPHDESRLCFYVSHEEADLCLHVKNKGWKVFYLPDLRVLHDIKPGFAPKRDRLYYLYRNKFFVIKRNFPPLRRFTALAVAALLGLPRYLAESVEFHRGVNWAELRVVFRAVVDGLTGRGGPL
ncbi:MAG: glycosyltransferase family 2 protein [Elusimicrobiales bacterium]